MKIYVAGRFEDKVKVKKLYRIIKKNGHEISADWTNHKPYKKYPELAKGYTIEDINGVKKCDVFILITNGKPGVGSAIELGVAMHSYLTLSKPKIYVVGEFKNDNMFYYHPSVQRRKTIEEVLKEL